MCYYNWNVTKNCCQKVLTFYWDSLYREDEKTAVINLLICTQVEFIVENWVFLVQVQNPKP